MTETGDDFGHEKRQRSSRYSVQEARNSESLTSGPVDPMFGQRSVFPGLDGTNGNEAFYGPAGDGLEYLRMVR